MDALVCEKENKDNAITLNKRLISTDTSRSPDIPDLQLLLREALHFIKTTSLHSQPLEKM